MATIRPATEGDVEFLRRMLFEAAHWRPGVDRPTLDEALADPGTGRYIEGWGRKGDSGLIAEIGMGVVGAVWWRLFWADQAGHGFVDEDTPELTIAVVEHERGIGVGTQLLMAAFAAARREGFDAISLSVEIDNPACHLYNKCGFRSVAEKGNSRTMVCSLT